MRFLISLFILFFSSPIYSQVSIDSLWFNGMNNERVFNSYFLCDSNSLALTIDSGSTGGFEYQWNIYQTDTTLQKIGIRCASGDPNTTKWLKGLPNLAPILYNCFKPSASALYGWYLFELQIRNGAYKDTVSQPFIVFSNPSLVSTQVFLDGPDVFNSPSLQNFDTIFPGMWVDHIVPTIDIDFSHGFIEYYRVKLEKLDSSGTFIKKISTDFDFNRQRAPFHPFFRNFALNEHITLPSEKFINNTQRGFYKFTLYYGNSDCGEDSVFTYLRVINPNEFSLRETLPEAVNFFPNPVRDELMYSSLPESSGSYSIEIMDMSGRPVMETQLSETNGSIPLKLKSGFYIYHLKDQAGKVQQVGKLVAE